MRHVWVQTRPLPFVQLLRTQLAEQDWQAGAQQRYEKVMQWLGPRLSHSNAPIPKAAFDKLYGYIDEAENS